MLRFCYIFSICLHLFGLCIVSSLVAQHVADPLLAEKEFKVELKKVERQKASHRVDENAPRPPLKSVKPLLTQSQENLSIPPIIRKTVQQQEPELRSPELKPIAPIERTRSEMKPQPHIIPTEQEYEKTAKQFPTPVPTKKPAPKSTSAPTPRPTPVPTAKPTSVPTPIPTSEPAFFPTPRPLPAQTQKENSKPQSAQVEQFAEPLKMDASSSENVNAEQQDSQGEGVKGHEQEEQQTFLQHYLQEILSRINATKDYPRRARRKGWEGTVTVRLQIDSTGEVAHIELVEPSQYDTLNDAALEAVTRAQPFPGFSGKIAMETLTVNIPIQFTLQ